MSTRLEPLEIPDMHPAPSALPKASAPMWQDRKRYWWLMSPALPATALASVVAVIGGAPAGLLWLVPFLF